MRLIQAAKGKLIMVGYALMVVFGWWVPNNLLDTSPNLRLFTDFMASIVPQIDRVTVLGGVTAGNANRVLYSVLWVPSVVFGGAYLWFLVMMIRRSDKFKPGDALPMPIWKLVVTTAGGMLLACETIFMSYLRPGLRLVELSLVNRFWAGLWAPLLSIGAGFFMFAVIVNLMIIGIYANQRGQRHFIF